MESFMGVGANSFDRKMTDPKTAAKANLREDVIVNPSAENGFAWVVRSDASYFLVMDRMTLAMKIQTPTPRSGVKMSRAKPSCIIPVSAIAMPEM
jgi:hypothetical protein